MLSFKLVLLLVIWSWKYNNVLKKRVTSLQTLVTQIYRSALNIFPRWISKPTFKNQKTTTKQTMVQEDWHTFSVHAKRHNTMYIIVNLEVITNITYLGFITHNANPHWLTFHIMIQKLKRERIEILKLHLLVNKNGWFVLLIFVKM